MTNPAYQITDMFYVIYNTVTKQYRNEDGEWGSYADAERFLNADYFVQLGKDGRLVGPCVEGETP